ncbi:MAG: serine protease [Bryobacteraceae bacterium]|nr:serine protease [Bryobacteraceae bacterium]
MSTLEELSDALVQATNTASHYVVSVSGGTRFGASGVVWQPGVAVTTRSTLRRDDNLRVTLPDGATVPATIAGHDPGTDLAVLRFEGTTGTRSNLADSTKPGQVVLAVGRSENTGLNVAMGVISAVGKPWQTWQGGRIDAYLRLDINLYPGGSGAAVVTTGGELLGIASGSLSRIAPVSIPAATIERVVGQILARGRVARPWIGVAVQPVPIPSTLAEAAQSVSHGLIVLGADAETPAGKAGVLVGDILLSVGGVPVRDPMDLRAALAQHMAGETIQLTLLRGGERRELSVTLGERTGRH